MACSHDDNIPANALMENVILDEMYFKQMMSKIVPGWLPHRDYSHLIKSVRYQQTVGDTMKFFVPNSYNGWSTYIKFDEWHEQVNDPEITAVEAARLLFWGANMRLHCSCPAFIFWGSQYILTQTDSAIVPEMRFPHVRNPHLKGLVCKHLNRTLKVLPYHLGDMAREIKNQREHPRGN